METLGIRPSETYNRYSDGLRLFVKPLVADR